MGFSSTPKDTTFGKIFGLTLSICDLPKASYPQQGYLLRMSRFVDLGGLRPPPCQASFRIFTGTQAPQLYQNLSGRSKQSHFFTPTLPTLVDAWPETSIEKRKSCVPTTRHLHPIEGTRPASLWKRLLPCGREASARMYFTFLITPFLCRCYNYEHPTDRHFEHLTTVNSIHPQKKKTKKRAHPHGNALHFVS